MQAVILAGGEGTRLRPLTSNVPKPIVRLVDRPFISFMLEWLRGHGVDDVILSCGFMAERVRSVLGDGSELGIRLRYVEEPEPRGTGRRAEARRADARRALPDAQRRRPDRHRPRRPDRPARAHRRARDAGAGGRCPIRAPTGWWCSPRTARCATSSRSRAPASAPPTNLISAGAYVLEREILELMRAWAQGLDRGRGVAAAGRRRPLRLSLRELLAGHRHALRATCRGPSTSSRATSQTAVRARLGADWLAVGEGAEVRGRLIPPALLGARTRRSPRGRASAAWWCSARTSRSGRASTVERSVILDGARIGEGCELRDCIVAPGASVGDRTEADRWSGARRRRAHRGGQRDHSRGAYLPRGGSAGPGDRVLGRRRADRAPSQQSQGAQGTSDGQHHSRGADQAERSARRRGRAGALARGDRRDRPLRPARRRARAARAPARRSVAGGVGDHGGPRRARGPGGGGDGRLGDRRRAGARGARRPRLTPDLRDARLRASDVDDAGHDGAVRELLRRDRGDARLLRVRRCARRAAHGRDHRRAARRDGARRRRARDPAAGRLPAPRRGRLHDRRRARGGGPVRRRHPADVGDRRGGLPHRAAGRASGAPRLPRAASRRTSRAACSGPPR